MKRPIIILIVLIVLGLAVWFLGGRNGASNNDSPTATSTGTVSAPVSGTTKLSDKLSEYRNEELGFSIKYPSVWDLGTANTGVTLVIPTEKSGPNSVRKLEAKVVVTPGKCAFPPVTTIKERSTLQSGNLSFNMISMSNSVQGTDYFDRMYSQQREGICYILSLSSVIAKPAVKGSEATQMTNNNKAIVEAADQAFINMVKSFAYVVGPAGQDEATVVPTKK